MKPWTFDRSNPSAAGPSTLRGMGFMLLGGLAGTLMAASVRHLSSDVHPFEIAFFRAFFGCLAFSPLLLRHGVARMATNRIGLQILRGTMQACGTLFFFTALSLAPLAKVTALNFSSPLFSTVLAIVLLGEVVRARRIVALVAGFAGTLVIVRPGYIPLDLGTSLILINAFTIAAITIVTKVLMRTESSAATTLYGFLFTMPIALVATIPVWEMPTLADLLWLAVIGSFGGISNLFFAQALKEADITAVLPLGFFKLIWASVLGYLAFAEVPDPWTWIGGAMIFAASTYLAFRERKIGARPTAAPAVAATD